MVARLQIKVALTLQNSRKTSLTWEINCK